MAESAIKDSESYKTYKDRFAKRLGENVKQFAQQGVDLRDQAENLESDMARQLDESKLEGFYELFLDATKKTKEDTWRFTGLSQQTGVCLQEFPAFLDCSKYEDVLEKHSVIFQTLSTEICAFMSMKYPRHRSTAQKKSYDAIKSKFKFWKKTWEKVGKNYSNYYAVRVKVIEKMITYPSIQDHEIFLARWDEKYCNRLIQNLKIGGSIFLCAYELFADGYLPFSFDKKVLLDDYSDEEDEPVVDAVHAPEEINT